MPPAPQNIYELSKKEPFDWETRPLRAAGDRARASLPPPDISDKGRASHAAPAGGRLLEKAFESGPRGRGGAARGSMTLEAAIVVPLFLFFIMNIVFIMEMVRLQSGLQAALQQVGDQICEAAYYTKFGGDSESVPEEVREGGGAGSGDALSFVLSETFVRSRVVSYLGRDYLDHTCLQGGAGGLSFAGSEIMKDGGRVDLVVGYRIRPFVRVLAPGGFSMQARYSGHAWVGWMPGDGAGGEAGSGAQGQAYVTRYGSVYHLDPDCIYLNPQVRAVPGASVDQYRSGNGAKYYPCEYCRPDRSGTVYITKEGNRYHSSDTCGAITRHVRQMDAEAAQENLRPCPKCGQAH